MINIIRMLTVDEGLKLAVYKDTKGINTVGIGFNMDDINARSIWTTAQVSESFDSVKSGTSEISKESAWKLLNVCVDNCKEELTRIFPEFEGFPEGVQLALVNLMYNMGYNKFSEFKTTINLVKAGNYGGAAENLSHTLWSSQVGKRKDRIMALFNEDDSLYS